MGQLSVRTAVELIRALPRPVLLLVASACLPFAVMHPDIGNDKLMTLSGLLAALYGARSYEKVMKK